MSWRCLAASLAPERAGHWLPPGAWQACLGEPQFTRGEPIWVGVDVGGDRSASAVVWLNQNLHVGVEIFHGDKGVLRCPHRRLTLPDLREATAEANSFKARAQWFSLAADVPACPAS